MVPKNILAGISITYPSRADAPLAVRFCFIAPNVSNLAGGAAGSHFWRERPNSDLLSASLETCHRNGAVLVYGGRSEDEIFALVEVGGVSSMHSHCRDSALRSRQGILGLESFAAALESSQLIYFPINP